MTVLKKMLDLNMITQAEYDEAAAEDIYAHLVCKETAEEESNAKHNWFVEAAVQQIKADLMEKKNMEKNHKTQPVTETRIPHRREANGWTRRSFAISSAHCCC